MTYDISPQVSEQLIEVARIQGIDPNKLLENLVVQYLPAIQEKAAPKLTPKNAAALAYLRQRIEEEATDDPEEIRKADAEVDELMRNLDRNRIESGERPLFP